MAGLEVNLKASFPSGVPLATISEISPCCFLLNRFILSPVQVHGWIFLCVCHRNSFISQVIICSSQNGKCLERTLLRESNTQKTAAAQIYLSDASLSCLAKAWSAGLAFLCFKKEMQGSLFISLVQDAHLGEGEGCHVTIPTPLPQWGRRQNISASPLVANVPKIMIYSTDSVCVGEGKGISPLSCTAAPASWQTESGDGRNEVLAVTQSRWVTCFHFSGTVLERHRSLPSHRG